MNNDFEQLFINLENLVKRDVYWITRDDQDKILIKIDELKKFVYETYETRKKSMSL